MTTGRWWWIGAFVAVDLVLLAVMWAHLSGDDAASPPAVATSPSEAPPPSVPAVPLLADAAGDMTVWAERGDCRAAADVALVRLSGDERETLSPGVAEVLALEVTAAGDLYVVGADATCDVVERVLDEGSETWRDSVGAIARWHLAPQAGSAVVTPAATTEPGCPVLAIEQDGDAGRVACSDGTVRGSVDEGQTWQELGRLEGLVAATVETEALALAPAEGCGVAAFTSSDGGTSWQQAGCVAEEYAASVGVARADDLAVAVLGDQVLRSTDAGATWEPVAPA